MTTQDFDISQIVRDDIPDRVWNPVRDMEIDGTGVLMFTNLIPEVKFRLKRILSSQKRSKTDKKRIHYTMG